MVLVVYGDGGVEIMVVVMVVVDGVGYGGGSGRYNICMSVCSECT